MRANGLQIMHSRHFSELDSPDRRLIYGRVAINLVVTATSRRSFKDGTADGDDQDADNHQHQEQVKCQ
ncbi:hypothetical protein OUZ56_013219 [Daphnia magna]|uniref:Uncharacterized protein n=1 Tax=Daphnia magna TaxID=35525 RepID=A0ABQ9Z572_9CRUS|nr:hypothetical protein OUZ56_013219 [Daphnia magna]